LFCELICLVKTVSRNTRYLGNREQSARPAILAKVQLDDIGNHAQRVFEASIAPRKETETGVSFIITKAQKAELRHRGYTEEQIREMKPEEAHRALGLIS
jgi:hypothetical protein